MPTGTAQDATQHAADAARRSWRCSARSSPNTPAAGCRRSRPSSSTTLSAEAGAFKVTVLRNGTELAVSFVPDRSAPPPAAAAAPARRRPRPREHAGARARSSPRRRPVAATPSIALFRLMVDAKASDLHLSSNMPPLIRKDGHMQPLDPGIGADGARGCDGAAASRSCPRPIARSSSRGTTPTSPTRSRAWPASAPTCSSTARAPARCSASSRPRS